MIVHRISANIDNGGWQATGEVYNNADSLDFYQKFDTFFELYAAGWGDLPRAAFVGHLLPEPWEKTFQTSRAPFTAFTAQEFLKRGEIQGIYFKDVETPANDHQIDGLTYAAIVNHILRGHSNLVRDEFPEGIIWLDVDHTNSSPISEYELKQGNFWSRLQELADADFYLLYFDKGNSLNFHPHPMFETTLPDPVLNLTSSILSQPLQIERRNTETISQIIVHGVTTAGAQFTAVYPPDPGGGPIVRKTGYMAANSSKAAEVAERMQKFENRDYTVTAKIGNGLGLLLDLMDRVSITYTSAVDGINWDEKMFWVHGIEVELKPDSISAITTLKLEAENA